jgi:hypothetical protein
MRPAPFPRAWPARHITRQGAGDFRRPEHLGQHGGVFHGLRHALCLIGRHGVACIAEQRDASLSYRVPVLAAWLWS